MKFKYFYESQSFDSLTIPAGTKLYHGTVEQFEKEKLIPGGYDDVLWTAENPNVARSYIPAAGSSVMTNSKNIASPSQEDSIQNIQKQMGIFYDYDQVEFEPNGRVRSSMDAPVFSEISDKQTKAWKRFSELKQKFEEYRKNSDNDEFLDTLSDEETDDFFDKFLSVEEAYKKAEEEYHSYDVDQYKNEYVNKKLVEFGYEPDTERNYDKNHIWKLKLRDNKLAKSDHKDAGRLLTLTPKRDLKIYDMTMGETLEPDLTDKQYHALNAFRKAEEEGYDGIKIADYAQNEYWGNVGHYSIGIFKDIIKDFNIEEIEATHPDKDEL